VCADLPQGEQVDRPFADPKVASIVDDGLGPQRPALLVVLLDPARLVVDVQVRHDAVGDDSCPEATRGLADDLAVEMSPIWSGRPRSRFSRITPSKKIRPVWGRSMTWVRLTSINSSSGSRGVTGTG
jgi:hypothetical protein